MKEAPLFIRAYDLHSWLLDRLDVTLDRTGDSVRETTGFQQLARTVLRHSSKLLNAICLAVARFDSGLQLVEADEQATLLRIHLRLASDKKLLDDGQLIYVSGELADIGRQIGGWRRHLEELE